MNIATQTWSTESEESNLRLGLSLSPDLLSDTHTSLQSYTERKLFSNIVPRWLRRFEQSRIIYDRLRDLQVWSDLTKILRLFEPEIMGRNQDFLTILSLNTYFLCQDIFYWTKYKIRLAIPYIQNKPVKNIIGKLHVKGLKGKISFFCDWYKCTIRAVSIIMYACVCGKKPFLAGGNPFRPAINTVIRLDLPYNPHRIGDTQFSSTIFILYLSQSYCGVPFQSLRTTHWCWWFHYKFACFLLV